jgi:hypothetical protein
MSTSKTDLAKRFQNAAGSRAEGRKPEGRTAVRTKPVRITVDLDPTDYLALKRWLESAAAAVEPEFPKPLQQQRAVRAMIRATVADDVVNAVVVDLLKKDRETAR